MCIHRSYRTDSTDSKSEQYDQGKRHRLRWLTQGRPIHYCTYAGTFKYVVLPLTYVVADEQIRTPLLDSDERTLECLRTLA